VAIERGPLVYCMEQLDQAESGPLCNYSLALNERTVKQIEASFDSSLLDGVMALRAPGLYAAEDPGARQTLYHPKSIAAAKPVSLKLIPYYAFANRAPSEMQVWIPYTQTS
jgi:DUF1680 family protein